MAMLQRRFASSIYAVRRSLERMRDAREKILEDPRSYRQEQIEKQHPRRLRRPTGRRAAEDPLRSRRRWWRPWTRRPFARRSSSSGKLIDQARELEGARSNRSSCRLQGVPQAQGVFEDPKMKLLLFTEHKDTLDYLVGKLREWGLTVTQIHGGMKIGDRDTQGQPPLRRARANPRDVGCERCAAR